ncbi:zinc finger protein 106 isoform X2 [Hippoglossus stenolepis]|uniref:zinc finger protein 106 isoform X2 n=1 Tax=Hippoglossus stenolepis TaxID=195615 RepID=UPI001FAFF5AD|nr:zinc finger protein 106 isoform X2 [Hippoglossus stenolepis]
MSVVPTPQGAVGKKPVKKKGKKKPQQQQSERLTQCILCRKSFSRREAHEHMHGMLHHRELESALGRDVFHECQACKVYAMGLYDYTQHISTPLHRAKLQGLMSRNTKPLPLVKTLSQEAISRIRERNKTLKKEEKKQKGKKKKKQKQIAAQKRVEKVQGSTKRSAVASNVVKMQKPKQVNQRTQQQMQRTLQKGRSNVVVQNKENKVSSVQRPLRRSETTPQNQSGRLAGSSGQPAGRTWHHDHVREQFPQPGSHTSSHTSSYTSSHMRYSDNFSVYNQRVNVEHSQTWRSVNRPHNTYDGARTDMSEQVTWPDNSHYDDYYSRQYSGATMFDHNQNERTRSSQPGQESSHRSSSPASANRSSGAAPLRDADVSTMLRQVRRTLGVREPCRADREARRQNSEASDRVADRSTTQQTGAAKGQPSGAASTSVQYPQVNIFVPAAPSGVRPSNVTPATPKQTTVKVTQEMTGCAGNGESSEQSNHRVRIAHEPRRSQTGKEVGRKSLNSSGAKNKLSWSEMYNKRKRERQVSITRTPRLRIELSNPPPEHRSSTQPPDTDLPLSEGFHWESIPVSPSPTHLTLPPPPQDTTEIDSHRDEQSGSLLQEPGTSDQGASSHTVTAAPGQAEPSVNLENGGLGSANKRKHTKDDDISEKESNGKKKRTNSNKDQGQMDQLLAVSLREDELSHSLQDLDISLIQARNALQTAYTEVQRILLLRQQFSAEVNTLRAKRIEILQGMQGASNITTASSAGAAAPPQPRHSPLSSSSAFLASSSQQPSATTSVSPISHPRPTPTSVKEEATAAQAGQFVSSSTDAPHVPLNQPVPSLPSELLPPLLLGPSHSASPTTSAAAAASTSVNTRLQQGQESREASKDCVRTTKLPKEAAWMILSDSEEETRGNLGREAADKPLPEIDRDASAAALFNDDGNESDDSVKMMEPSDPVVINIDESDEDLPEAVLDVSAHPEQQVSSVELSCASTQTFQQKEVDRKIPISLPVKAAQSPAESVEDEEPSLGEFLSHAGPVHGMQVHEGLLYTCSGDNTARAYSLTTRESKAVFEGHTNKVNCLLVSSLPSCRAARLYTGSSDQTIRCYSVKSKKCLQRTCLADRVLCLHIAWNILYAGLANGSVVSYDLKTLKQLDVFECHGPRGVSCMGTSQEGARRVLLVGSYDSTVSIRDAKSGLLLRSLDGHTKTVLCMKVVNDLVFSGSSDTSVHAHNIHTGELLRIYKGHGHAVTSIVILGKVMVTACLDQLVRVYELQSHDCLQVYGVHSDMVMCMTIHKSVIYTGCYDGSVQAVKLNLLNNYRCWWQNCSLIFGMAEHLVQHLVGDHSKPSLQMVKCRWRGCEKFFSTQQAVRQKLPDHMRNHVENDSKTQP